MAHTRTHYPRNVGLITAPDRRGYGGPRPQAPARPAKLRDALTGLVLIDADGQPTPECGDYFIRTKTPYRVRIKMPAGHTVDDYGRERVLLPVPLTLDTHQIWHDKDGGGQLGGLQWGRDFARYVDGLLSEFLEDYDRETLREWWTSAYARERVTRGFVHHFSQYAGTIRLTGVDRHTIVRVDPHEKADDVVRVVFAALADWRCVSALMAETHLSYDGLKRWTRLAHIFAFTVTPTDDVLSEASA